MRYKVIRITPLFWRKDILLAERIVNVSGIPKIKGLSRNSIKTSSGIPKYNTNGKDIENKTFEEKRPDSNNKGNNNSIFKIIISVIQIMDIV